MFYRITDQRHERLPYFVFGDFNFRLDSKQVIEVSAFALHLRGKLVVNGKLLRKCNRPYNKHM